MTPLPLIPFAWSETQLALHIYKNSQQLLSHKHPQQLLTDNVIMQEKFPILGHTKNISISQYSYQNFSKQCTLPPPLSPIGTVTKPVSLSLAGVRRDAGMIESTGSAGVRSVACGLSSFWTTCRREAWKVSTVWEGRSGQIGPCYEHKKSHYQHEACYTLIGITCLWEVRILIQYERRP